jgi:single-stranded-DNA-specific exonuclease
LPARSKRWLIGPPLPHNEAARFQHFHPVVAQILYNRGFTTPDSARAFLTGQIPTFDPFKMRGIPQAVGRIRLAIKKKELIVVYGDFDADGVTSTALLVTVLACLGANVKPYIPHRVDEGYGLNAEALVKLAQKGARVVITVDCGIRSLAEVVAGKRAGLDMIITDHHSVGPEIPAALAVINPKQEGCPYPEKMLAGVGVAYKLAEALIKVTVQQERRELPIQPDDLLDLVAVGTVADLAPLSHAENRSLVVRGLEQLRSAKRLGIRALLDAASLVPNSVDATSIGFVIGPRLNAAGRLESAMTAYELLSTDDPQKAMEHAHTLQGLNEKRQQLTREAQEYARTVAQIDDSTSLIFVADSNFQQGIVGLVAGRLTEEYYRPAIILHKGEQESHGSCRSIAELNITEALDQCADLLIRHGGHAQAAGFAIDNDNLPQFQEQITHIVTEGLRNQDLRPMLNIDAEVILPQLDLSLYEALRDLEPCGHDHAAPILCSRNLHVNEARLVGKDNAHLKLKLSDGVLNFDAIAFRYGETFSKAGKLPPFVDVAYQLDLNEWNGTQRLQMKVQDIRAAE